MGKFFGTIFGVGVLVALFSAFGSWYTIDASERGVLLRNGAVVGEVEPGLHFKTPWIESVETIDVRSTFSRAVMESYSKDQQAANLTVSVMYHPAPAGVVDIYTRYKTLDALGERALQPKILEQTKNVFGRYDAVSAVQDRTKLNAEIGTAVSQAIKELKIPIVIEGIQVENIAFSAGYMQSIEQRMQAGVEVDRIKQNALREKVTAEITVTKANANADALRAQAGAEAAAIKLRGEAEASAITARAKALGENPGLVALTAAEKWNGVLPQTMVPGGATPFVSVK